MGLTIVLVASSGCSAKDGTIQIVDSANSIYIVNINAKTSTPKKPLSLELNAGTYEIKVVGISGGGTYDAWKAWILKPKQNKKGVWKYGWLNKYSYNSDELPEVTYFDSLYHGTPKQALAHALDGKFALKDKTTVYFYIVDKPYWDNKGGISLRIAPVSPENQR